MKTFFFKVLPFIIALLAGTVIFLISHNHIDDVDTNAMVLGVASGLISIPLVFIFYELFENMSMRVLKRSLMKHFSFNANSILLEMIMDIKTLLNDRTEFTKENLNAMLALSEGEIIEKIVLNENLVESLKKSASSLQVLLQQPSIQEILSKEQVRHLLDMIKELGMLAREIELPEIKREREHAARSMRALNQAIEGWLETSEEDAIINHEHLRFFR